MNILIMTATIAPPEGAPGLLRVDPELRLADYAKALTYYLKFLGKTIDRIIFAENSNSNVDALRQIVKQGKKEKEVEFIVYDGMDHPAAYGRCYSESRLLDYVMTNSNTVYDCGDKDVFWKVTGRYSLVNLTSMIASKPDCHFYCDLRNFRSPWADMRFMAWSKHGYRSVFNDIGKHIREDINLGRPGEETLHKHLLARVATEGFTTILMREPLFDGIRAYDNQNWSQGRQRMVFFLRQSQRILFRRIYI